MLLILMGVSYPESRQHQRANHSASIQQITTDQAGGTLVGSTKQYSKEYMYWSIHAGERLLDALQDLLSQGGDGLSMRSTFDTKLFTSSFFVAAVEPRGLHMKLNIVGTCVEASVTS